MRKAPVFVALSLLAAAGPAAAQAPQAPKPAPAEERPRLNLKLDNPGQYARETPREAAGGNKDAKDNLPSLGGNAVSFEPSPASRSRTPTSPYPKDTETGR